MKVSVMHAFRFKTLPRPACTLFQSSGAKVLVWLGACTGDALTRYRDFFFFFLPGLLLAMAALPHLSLSGCVTLTRGVCCHLAADSASAATRCVFLLIHLNQTRSSGHGGRLGCSSSSHRQTSWAGEKKSSSNPLLPFQNSNLSFDVLEEWYCLQILTRGEKNHYLIFLSASKNNLMAVNNCLNNGFKCH